MNRDEKIRRELEKAETLIDLGYLDTAIERADIVLKMDPDNIEALTFKGTALDMNDKLNEAISCFDRILELESDNEIIWDYKGFILYKLEDYSGAIDCFKKSIAVNHRYDNAYYNLACAYSKLEQKKETLDTLKELLELEPRSKSEIKNEEDFDWLKDDPEFKELLNKK
jgi:tetratricopeptide (TPR) repeat protein